MKSKKKIGFLVQEPKYKVFLSTDSRTVFETYMKYRKRFKGVVLEQNCEFVIEYYEQKKS